jgi:hypothetical protein
MGFSWLQSRYPIFALPHLALNRAEFSYEALSWMGEALAEVGRCIRIQIPDTRLHHCNLALDLVAK